MSAGVQPVSAMTAAATSDGDRAEGVAEHLEVGARGR